jgi:outer membrane protein assembly factor BamD (BamD/ComL family)
LTGVYEVLKDKAGAVNEMNELIQKHPNSKISEEAERRLQHIEEWKF